jgi:hypothetical protein
MVDKSRRLTGLSLLHQQKSSGQIANSFIKIERQNKRKNLCNESYHQHFIMEQPGKGF